MHRIDGEMEEVRMKERTWSSSSVTVQGRFLASSVVEDLVTFLGAPSPSLGLPAAAAAASS